MRAVHCSSLSPESAQVLPDPPPAPAPGDSFTGPPGISLVNGRLVWPSEPGTEAVYTCRPSTGSHSEAPWLGW